MKTHPILYLLFLKLFLAILLVAQILSVEAQKILITNVSIVDVEQKQQLQHKTIRIENGFIKAISDTILSLQGYDSIDGSHLIALPGFVNTHTHLWQHICKACYPKESLQQWVRIYRTIHYLTAEELYKVVLAASSEALLSGITTVSDYASLGFNDYGFETNLQSMKDAGLNGVAVWNNPSIFLPDSIKLTEIQRLQEKYKDNFTIWMGFGPLSFYSLPQVYSGIYLSKKLHLNNTEHTMENNQEQRDLYDNLSKYYSTYENNLLPDDKIFLEHALSMTRPSDNDAYQQLLRKAADILKADSLLHCDTLYKSLTEQERLQLSSLSSPRLISPIFILNYLDALQDFVSIHSVWLQQPDIDIVKQHNISISHNPESNLYLSSGIAPVNDYLREKINVTIGTDGAASNDGIDFFSAMKSMWNVYKINSLNTEITKSIDPWDIIQAATINGARALKLDSMTGSIAIGKQADIILLSSDELGTAPIRDDKLIPLLIYSASTRNVRYVLSKGDMIVENGRLKKYDEHALASDLTNIANVVDQRIDAGKIWRDTYTIRDREMPLYWYRYRSIRKADSVYLIIENSTSQSLNLSIIFSGEVFGGGTPFVVDKAVAKRFPDLPPSGGFRRDFLIRPKEKIIVSKAKQNFVFILENKKRCILQKASIGQLLVVAQNR